MHEIYEKILPVQKLFIRSRLLAGDVLAKNDLVASKRVRFSIKTRQLTPNLSQEV